MVYRLRPACTVIMAVISVLGPVWSSESSLFASCSQADACVSKEPRATQAELSRSPPPSSSACAHQDCTPPATIGGTRLFWQSVHRKTQCVVPSGRERTSRLVLPRRRGHLRCSPALGQQAVACGSFETRSTRADDAMDSGRTTTRINDDRNSMPINCHCDEFWGANSLSSFIGPSCKHFRRTGEPDRPKADFEAGDGSRAAVSRRLVVRPCTATI